ncbi:hypothetical protein HDE_08045 [Halotydeus destructor]|nr:hypothetical protein HDE_08045 [Halotydeus destructor]
MVLVMVMASQGQPMGASTEAPSAGGDEPTPSAEEIQAVLNAFEAAGGNSPGSGQSVPLSSLNNGGTDSPGGAQEVGSSGITGGRYWPMSLQNNCGEPGKSKKSNYSLDEDDALSAFGHFEPGHMVHYSCLDPVYDELIGPSVRTCRDGQWSGPIPRCGNAINASFDAQSTVYDDFVDIAIRFADRVKFDKIVIHMDCTHELQLINDAIRPRSVNSNCRLSQVNTTINETSMLNATLTCNSFSIEETSEVLVKFRMDQQEGANVTVQAVTMYSGQDDECSRLDTPMNGFQFQLVFRNKQPVPEISCNKHYNISGNLNDTCSKNKEWFSPTCIHNPVCTKFESQDRMMIAYQPNDFNETHVHEHTNVIISCLELDGSSRLVRLRTCQMDGSWNGRDVNCSHSNDTSFEPMHIFNTTVETQTTAGNDQERSFLPLILGLIGLVVVISVLFFLARRQIYVKRRSLMNPYVDQEGTRHRTMPSYRRPKDDLMPDQFDLETPPVDRRFDLTIPHLTLQLGTENEFKDQLKRTSLTTVSTSNTNLIETSV